VPILGYGEPGAWTNAGGPGLATMGTVLRAENGDEMAYVFDMI
jgi:hypothetical protein